MASQSPGSISAKRCWTRRSIAPTGTGGNLRVLQADVHDMPFEYGRFDQVFTSCTFCSVPKPVDGLRALRRVLKPNGELFMFEHTGSWFFPFKPMMDLMTLLSRRIGPDMNRPTVENVLAAGYQLKKVTHVYMDVVKTVPCGPGLVGLDIRHGPLFRSRSGSTNSSASSAQIADVPSSLMRSSNHWSLTP